jgi:hypothetical protein
MYKRLQENLPNECRITRLESRVGLGIPDCLIAIRHAGFCMVELKVVKRGRRIKFSPHQIAFHAAHAALHAPTYILVQWHPPGVEGIVGAHWYLYKGEQVRELYEDGIDVIPYQQWPADQVRWHLLRYALTC